MIRKLFSSLLFCIIGLAVGYGFHRFMMFLALVAVKVRPGLAGLSLIEALFSGHFIEWLWYLYASYLLWLMIIVFGFIGLIIGVWLGD